MNSDTSNNGSLGNEESRGDVPLFRSAAMVVDQSPAFMFDRPVAVAKTIEPVTLTQKPAPHQNGWVNPQLTTVGLYYPLGPSIVRLTKSRLVDLLQALPEMFRKLSLQTMYKESPIAVTARSLEQVEFEISIFESRENKQEVLVEFQRRDGDCVAYHKYAHQIMSEILGETAISPMTGSIWNQETMMRTESILFESTPADDSIVGAIDIAWGLLSTDRYDARKLGMESLMHMSDPNTSGFSTAKAVTKCLLSPESSVQQRVSRTIFGYATKNLGSNDFSESGHISDECFTYMALIIISQCFRIASKDQSIDVETFLDIYPGDLLENILDKVHEAHSHPHHAYYAVQSLVALCERAPALRSRINGRDVEEAHLYGDSCHFALAAASQKLLLSLQA